MRIQSAIILFSSLLFSKSSFANESSDFQHELLGIEENVNSIKKNVFSAKATLNLLRELVVQGSASGSRATVWQVNNLGRSYVVESVSYVLDGNSAFAKTDVSGELDKKKEMMVFEGEMPTGMHSLSVEMKLRGNGFGIFNYVDQYAFVVQSSTNFSSEEGQNCIVRVVSEARSVLSYSFYERPNIKFQTVCSEMSE
jgi:hypothetical protein